MPDYGHELQFGSFLTPRAGAPHEVVALAQAAERAGLDLVTFQDHPYQPRFLDTWTLLSFVAARTERVHLAPNVLNLPLRQPAVTARAAASLDLLSDGRVELGLGAGAFWDAIEAMGGERLAPSEAVAALAEAIEVIRGIWNPGAPGVLRVPGEHHRVDGAKRGPAPAHDIAIWLGARGPRMLRLTGHRADGWLPSLGYLTPDAIPAANARIDDATLEAGRRPEAVRRLLNIGGSFGSGDGVLHGPPSAWAERLAELTLTHGFATYILASDEAGDLARFGEEVAPAVRRHVDDERRRGGLLPTG